MRFKLFIALLVLSICAAVPMQAQSHSVGLSWTASTDAATNPNLTYNVYRANSPCTAVPLSLVKIGFTTTPAVTFNDVTVTVGAYCYAVTAVVNGAESDNSNLAQASIRPSAPTTLVAISK